VLKVATHIFVFMSCPAKRKARTNRLAPLIHLRTYSHPRQEAQQSAEGQHDTLAAFTAPARLSAITAINTIALMFFMDFSPLKD
jgi:hypothetical protein